MKKKIMRDVSKDPHLMVKDIVNNVRTAVLNVLT